MRTRWKPRPSTGNREGGVHFARWVKILLMVLTLLGATVWAFGQQFIPGRQLFTVPTTFTKLVTFSATPTSATFGGTVTSTKACAAGYTRRGPNFCQRNTGVSPIVWTDAIACTGRTFTGDAALPTDATAALVSINWRALSNNAIANRVNVVSFYPDSGCAAGIVNQLNVTIREFAAVVAGTNIGETQGMFLVPLAATNTFYATQNNAGGNGNVDITTYFAVGYFD